MEHRSEKMMQTALANEWKAQVKPTIPASQRYEDIVWDLYCVRGQETMHVQWIGDRQQTGTYTYGDYQKFPQRRDAVIKLLTGKPDARKLKSKEEVDEAIQSRSVPWVHDTPAVEILLEVMNKDITWVRKMDGEVCRATVQVDKQSKSGLKYFRVYENKHGSRTLEWTDMFGFHAVGLDQIIDVA